MTSVQHGVCARLDGRESSPTHTPVRYQQAKNLNYERKI